MPSAKWIEDRLNFAISAQTPSEVKARVQIVLNRMKIDEALGHEMPPTTGPAESDSTSEGGTVSA